MTKLRHAELTFPRSQTWEEPLLGMRAAVFRRAPQRRPWWCVKRLKAYARVGSTPRGINRESEQRPGADLQAWKEVGVQHRREIGIASLSHLRSQSLRGTSKLSVSSSDKCFLVPHRMQKSPLSSCRLATHTGLLLLY